MNQHKRTWSSLKRLQLGKYAEYLVKMEFIQYGCDVFTAEVDSHGIDFVVRTKNGTHFDVQAKSFRLQAEKGTPYVFLQKTKFIPDPALLLALVQFETRSTVVTHRRPESISSPFAGD
jgi:hypothetical protein